MMLKVSCQRAFFQLLGNFKFVSSPILIVLLSMQESVELGSDCRTCTQKKYVTLAKLPKIATIDCLS